MNAADELLLGQFLIIYPMAAAIAAMLIFAAVESHGKTILRAIRLVPLALIDLSVLALSVSRRAIQPHHNKGKTA